MISGLSAYNGVVKQFVSVCAFRRHDSLSIARGKTLPNSDTVSVVSGPFKNYVKNNCSLVLDTQNANRLSLCDHRQCFVSDDILERLRLHTLKHTNTHIHTRARARLRAVDRSELLQ